MKLWIISTLLCISEVESRKQYQLRPPPPRPITRRNDVLVWDIDNKFVVNVSGISNIEIASDQVKDNIDKVGTIFSIDCLYIEHKVVVWLSQSTN